MAIFYNQATLSYRGGVTNSNITAGELLDSVAVTKTATARTYAPGDLITYIVTVSNNGAAAVSGVTITEDLGAYEQAGQLLYPLEIRGEQPALLCGRRALRAARSRC